MFLSDRDGAINAWLSQIGSGEPVTINKGHSLSYNPTIRYTGFSGDGSQVWYQQLGDGRERTCYGWHPSWGARRVSLWKAG